MWNFKVAGNVPAFSERTARALAGGAKNIERVDKLVQSIAAQKGQSLNHLDEIVGLVDHWLTKNRG